MQNYRLTVDKMLDHAARWFGESGTVQALPGDGRRRTGYAEIRLRANRMSGALAALGLKRGQRFATLGWNTQHHLEIYYATMGMGLVCHTLNPRLTAAQLAAMVNEAEDVAIAVAVDLLPLARKLAPLCPALELIVVMDEPAGQGAGATDEALPVHRYEDLLAGRSAPAIWGDFAEETPAGLCYTSGTTGNPKGVLYSHRSNYLHTVRSLQADAFAISARDTVLVAVPLFHANGWGLPFAVPAAGARMILPGRRLDGESLGRLMRDEGVTIAVGVPTVWLGVLDWLDEDGGGLPCLERVLVGGSPCPEALVRRVERLGARVQASWGMTELSPLGSVTPPKGDGTGSDNVGRPPLGLEIRLKDNHGVPLGEAREIVGQLWVRGASVIDRYFSADADTLDEDGFFHTGDLAMLDAEGNLVIRGRSKDLIKSGGEWINPAEIEAIVGTHPAIAAVAAIGRHDDKWGERPLLVIQRREGHAFKRDELFEMLRGKVADWWLPDEILEVPALPLAATGKIDKTRLACDYAAGTLKLAQASR